MKAIIQKTFLIVLVALVASNIAMAQRKIKGTVYMDGEPAAGITVEIHKGGTMMTSFDGKYELDADEKSKWIRFTFIDESKKVDLTPDMLVFDFPFTGKLPSEDAEESSGEVNLQTMEELMRDQNKDYMNELSLYTEFYKQEDFKSAMPHWRKIYNQYPKSHSNVYIQGAKMLESMIENAETDAEKDKLLNDLIKLYDKRAKHFGQNGYIAGRKATSWLRYKVDNTKRIAPLEGDEFTKAIKTGYEWAKESINEQGKETELPIFVLFMNTTRSLFKLGELPKETVVMNFEICNKWLNQIIASTDDAGLKADAKDKILPYIENSFGTSGAADCEALVSIFEPQFKQNANDVEFIKSMLDRLGKAKCNESQLFSDASEKLYELEPSARAAFNMARRYLEKDLAKSKEYFKQAMEQETDKDLLADYYYVYGTVLFIKENALSEARTYAKKALEINPDKCEANMLIGDIYVAASRNFDGSSLQKSAVFWLAVDYFEKARRGEDCSIDAANKVSTYKKYFPNKEDAFMEGLQAGQSYKVEGWINESTKVRF